VYSKNFGFKDNNCSINVTISGECEVQNAIREKDTQKKVRLLSEQL
jgi:hypothetical protein